MEIFLDNRKSGKLPAYFMMPEYHSYQNLTGTMEQWKITKQTLKHKWKISKQNISKENPWVYEK